MFLFIVDYINLSDKLRNAHDCSETD